MEPAGQTSPSFFKRAMHWLLSLGGALVLGVLVPCVLTWVCNHGLLMTRLRASSPDEITGAWYFKDLVEVIFIAGAFCSPGAVILACLLIFIGHWLAKSRKEERPVILWCAASGGLMAFLNFPGYLCIAFFEDDPLSMLRIVALFAVTGATCGFWIGWQAYLEEHPERGFFPRFSLRTLIAFGFGWGVLLMLFMPR